MSSIPKPNGKSVRDLHMRLEKHWLPRFGVDAEFRDLVHQRNKIETLEEGEDRNMIPIELHAGRAGGIVEHANGLLMASPDWHVDPITLNTEDARVAEEIERAIAALHEQQLVANNYWPSVGRDVLTYGRGFVKAMPMMSLWTAQEGFPVRNDKETADVYLDRVRKFKESEGRFPFVIQHVPALSILPLLDTNDNVLATIEVKYVTAKVLADDMGSATVQELIQRRTIKWYDELPVIEYIDTEWVAYLLAGTTPRDRTQLGDMPGDVIGSSLPAQSRSYESLRTWRHGLGKTPVVMIPGIRTELTDYQSRWKSFLFDAKEALEAYDFLLSRLITMVWAYYLPSYLWRLGASSAQFSGRDRPTLLVNLGGVTVMYADEDLDTLPIPQGLPDATMLLAQCDDIIQRHTLEDVLFGRVQGAAPAYQVNLRINVARSKLSPIAQNLAIGATRIAELFLRGVEQLGEAVLIKGNRVTTSMAKQHRSRISARIQPKSPADKAQDIGTANLALQFGLPWDWICEKILGIDDPATLRLRKDIEELEQLPPVKERLMQDALKELEALINEDEQQDLSQIDMSGLPPEFAAAAAQLIAGGASGGEVAAGEVGVAPSPEGGLGRGPYPTGAAPTTIAPRGLGTAKAQPQPSGTGIPASPLGEGI